MRRYSLVAHVEEEEDISAVRDARASVAGVQRSGGSIARVVEGVGGVGGVQKSGGSFVGWGGVEGVQMPGDGSTLGGSSGSGGGGNGAGGGGVGGGGEILLSNQIPFPPVGFGGSPESQYRQALGKSSGDMHRSSNGSEDGWPEPTEGGASPLSLTTTPAPAPTPPPVGLQLSDVVGGNHSYRSSI